MKARFITLTVLFFIATHCQAQVTFRKLLGEKFQGPCAITQQATNDGYIIAGSTEAGGSMYLTKTDASANTTWTKTYGPFADSRINSIQETFDNGYILGGQFYYGRSQVPDFYLMKTDSDGNILWSKYYDGLGNGNIYRVLQTKDSGYAFFGETDIHDFYFRESYPSLVKVSRDGDIVWQKFYPHGKDMYAGSFDLTMDNGYIFIEGYSNNGCAVIRTNENGDTLWTRTYKPTNGTQINGVSIQQTSDSGFILCGTVYYSGGTEAYLLKITGQGNVSWCKTYDAGTDWGEFVNETYDGGFILGGGVSNGLPKMLLIRTNPLGDTIWTKAYPDSAAVTPEYIQPTHDNGFIMLGSTDNAGVDSGSFYLVKTDRNGINPCNERSNVVTVSNFALSVAFAGGGVAVNNLVAIDSVPLISTANLNEVTLCFSTGITEQTITKTLSLYPNPTSKELIINDAESSTSSIKAITIYNTLGEEIYNLQTSNIKLQTSIDVSSFPSGIYLVRMAGEKETWTGRFVKE